MNWPDGIKRGSGPKHLWELHTDSCKKCGMPRDGLIEFPERFYFCSVSRKEWAQRQRGASTVTGDA